MSLRQERVAFTALVAQLIVQANARKEWTHGTAEVDLAVDEWTIHTPRRMHAADGSKVVLQDGVHKVGSRHHSGLALDLLVYVNGEYVANGDHTIWSDLDKMAKTLDPRFSFGIEFRDANHLSWKEGS